MPGLQHRVKSATRRSLSLGVKTPPKKRCRADKSRLKTAAFKAPPEDAAFTLLDACSHLAPHQLPVDPKRQGTVNGWQGPAQCRPRIQLQFPLANPATNLPAEVFQRPPTCTSRAARNLAPGTPQKQPTAIATPHGSPLAIQGQRRKRSASAAGLRSDSNAHGKRHQRVQHVQEPVPQPHPPARASSTSPSHHVALGLAGISAGPTGPSSAILDAYETDFIAQPHPAVLGTGGQGAVLLRKWKPTFAANNHLDQRFVAVKVLKKGVKDRDAAEKALQDEALLSAALPCNQNIMRPLALVWKDATRQKLTGIVYPWMKGGDLLAFLNSFLRSQTCPRPSKEQRVAILRGTAEGVVAMHGANMAHLDIKPENVMIAHSQDGLPWQNKPLQSTDVRLGDCGMSLRMGPDEVVTHRCGTIGWRAPEQVHSDACSHKADSYGLGMIAAELVCPDFRDRLSQAVKLEADRCERTFFTSNDAEGGVLPEGLERLIKACLMPSCADDPEWVEIIRNCWDPLPSVRPTAADLLTTLNETYSSGEVVA